MSRIKYEINNKILEACNNDGWEASPDALNQVLQMTHSDFNQIEIVEQLNNLLIEYKNNWIQLFKLLSLIDYLIRNGQSDMITKFKILIPNITSCSNYEFGDREQNDHMRKLIRKIVFLINEAEKEELASNMDLLMITPKDKKKKKAKSQSQIVENEYLENEASSNSLRKKVIIVIDGSNVGIT